jgi:hypothetical protein
VLSGDEGQSVARNVSGRPGADGAEKVVLVDVVLVGWFFEGVNRRDWMGERRVRSEGCAGGEKMGSRKGTDHF